MLLANFGAMLLGLVLADLIDRRTGAVALHNLRGMVGYLDWFYLPLSFAVMAWIVVAYERPIRFCLDEIWQGRRATPRLLARARRRQLNEPFVLLGLDLVVWLLAVIIYPQVLHAVETSTLLLHRIMPQTIVVSVVTAFTAFLILGHLLRSPRVTEQEVVVETREGKRRDDFSAREMLDDTVKASWGRHLDQALPPGERPEARTP